MEVLHVLRWLINLEGLGNSSTYISSLMAMRAGVEGGSLTFAGQVRDNAMKNLHVNIALLVFVAANVTLATLLLLLDKIRHGEAAHGQQRAEPRPALLDSEYGFQS